VKQYIVVRADLAPGAQLAQACHVMKAFTRAHPECDGIENVAVLAAPDEDALLRLVNKAPGAVAVFREPDFDDSVTAIGLDFSAQKLLSNLPLALRH